MSRKSFLNKIKLFRYFFILAICFVFFPSLLLSQQEYKIAKYFNSLTSCTDSNAFVEDFDCVYFEVNYPQFINIYHSATNSLIENFIYRNFFDEPYNDFGEYSIDFFKKYEEDQRDNKPIYWLTINSDTVYFTEKTISIPFYGYEYQGGAHGSGKIASLNYNTITSKVIYFEDLIDYDYYEGFNSVVNKIIRKTPNENGFTIENDIDFFDSENYSYDNIDKRFLLKEKSLMIVLDYYDEGFRKGADYEIEIPYYKIRHLLMDEYLYLAN